MNKILVAAALCRGTPVPNEMVRLDDVAPRVAAALDAALVTFDGTFVTRGDESQEHRLATHAARCTFLAVLGEVQP